MWTVNSRFYKLWIRAWARDIWSTHARAHIYIYSISLPIHSVRLPACLLCLLFLAYISAVLYKIHTLIPFNSIRIHILCARNIQCLWFCLFVCLFCVKQTHTYTHNYNNYSIHNAMKCTQTIFMKYEWNNNFRRWRWWY